jgi:hypothetical protein
MRKFVLIPILALAATTWIAASQPQATRPTPQGMLTVDSIMRGPKLVGNPPTAIRFSKDSSQIYFSWQKAADERSATYSVNRDGSGLKQLTPDEAARVDQTRTGRLDRPTNACSARQRRRRDLRRRERRQAAADYPHGARRVVAALGQERHRRHLHARRQPVHHVLDPKDDATAFAQLTDIVTATEASARPPRRECRAGSWRRRPWRGRRSRRARRGHRRGALTDAQRLLAEQERQLMEYLKNQQGGRGGGGQGGGQGRAGGAGAPGAVPTTIARLSLSARQNVLDLQLSGDEKYVWVSVNERPEGTPRGQDVPNYVTASAYPEMIPGRANVGDVQGRRLLAAVEVGTNHAVWADASAFAGVERKTKPTDPDEPRALNWTAPDVSEDASYAIVASARSTTKIAGSPRSIRRRAKASIGDWLHDDAWIREQNLGTVAGLGGGTGIAWLPDNKRFLFLSEKDGYLHVYSVDMSAPAPAAKALTTASGK